MKKNLLKILACSAVVAMVASCGGKTPADSSSTSSEDPGIQYLDVSMQEINAIESDGSYSLEGQYVQFSNAAVSGAYADVVYVNCQEVTYYSDLIGVEVHQLEPGEFDYKDVHYGGLFNFYNIGASSSAENPVKAGLVWASGGLCQVCATYTPSEGGSADPAPVPVYDITV